MTWQQYPNTWLCSLGDVKLRKASSAGEYSEYDDDQLSLFIEQASADIIRNIQSLPIPHIATFLADWSKEYIDYDSKVLNLYKDADLLAVSSITNGNGSSIGSSQYTLKPNNSYPKHQISLKASSSARWRPASNGGYEQVISIVGTFGNVPHYLKCWKDTGITLGAAIADATSTSITVSSDSHGYTKGNYLQIDAEVFFVEAVNDATLTVARGELGTTAVAHDNSSTVELYIFKNDLKLACAEWAQYLYNTKDKNGEDIVTFQNGVIAPRGLAPTVINAVAGNKKRHLDGMID